MGNTAATSSVTAPEAPKRTPVSSRKKYRITILTADKLREKAYANTFAQFAVPDYEEVHMIDLRYFKMPVVDYIKENGITDVLILYNLSGFSSDKDIGILSK